MSELARMASEKTDPGESGGDELITLPGSVPEVAPRRSEDILPEPSFGNTPKTQAHHVGTKDEAEDEESVFATSFTEKNVRGERAERKIHREASTHANTHIRTHSSTIVDEWDVFISYRVNSDQKLAQDLYWRLVGTDIVVDGRARKLRVFWDQECLLSGESWEIGFSRAICRSTVIVLVLSRKAFTSIGTLTHESPCDNVILEFDLALELVFTPAPPYLPYICHTLSETFVGCCLVCCLGLFPDVSHCETT